MLIYCSRLLISLSIALLVRAYLPSHFTRTQNPLSTRLRLRNPLVLKSASSASSSQVPLTVSSKDRELIWLRNKYALELTVGLARLSLTVSRKLRPLSQLVEELTEKARVIALAEQQSSTKFAPTLTRAERVIVSVLSVLTIWSKKLVREMKAVVAVLSNAKWQTEKWTKWAVHLVGKSAKPLVSCTAGVFVLLADDWGPLYTIIMALFNAALSKCIKKAVRLPRPAGSPKGGYGMPSSHAQTLFYFFAFLSLQLLGVAQVPVKTDYFGTSTVAAGAGAAGATALPSVVHAGISAVGQCFGALATHMPAHSGSLLQMQASVPHVLTALSTQTGTVIKALFASQIFVLCAPVLLGAYAVSASLWRVATRLHSLPQTALGAMLGCVIGFLSYTRQPQVLAVFYESVLVPYFGYSTASGSSTTVVNTAVTAVAAVPPQLKKWTLFVGFVLLYSKELARWSKRAVVGHVEYVKTPAGMVKVKKHL